MVTSKEEAGNEVGEGRRCRCNNRIMFQFSSGLCGVFMVVYHNASKLRYQLCDFLWMHRVSDQSTNQAGPRWSVWRHRVCMSVACPATCGCGQLWRLEAAVCCIVGAKRWAEFPKWATNCSHLELPRTHPAVTHQRGSFIRESILDLYLNIPLLFDSVVIPPRGTRDSSVFFDKHLSSFLRVA